MSMLTVLSLVLATLLVSVQARTDIAAQLFDNAAISEPIAPTSLNKALTKLGVSVANFTSFKSNVQRAMLWSAGLVQANPDSTNDSSANYVQVYVLCGRTMSDVFQSAEALDDASRCPLKKCKSNVITFTESACEPSYVESKTLCALSMSSAGSSFGTLKTKTGPLWSTDGQLDENFDPQIFQFEDSSANDSTALYLLAQKGSWTMSDDTCPNGAQFIAPCREVAASEVDVNVQERTWCEPEIELGVKLWVNELNAATESGGDDSESSKVSSTVAIVLGVLLGIFIVAAFVFFVMWRHSRSYSNKDGLTENENNTFFMQAHSFRDQPQQGGHVSGQYVSNNGPHPSFDNAMQIEAINESFRMRSPELATFCDDQELMLKRIAFAGIIYSEKMTSGPNGEVWRGEYEGQQVAIKCTVAAAVAGFAAANTSRSSAMNASALLGDKELKALVDFTKEIRMAAFLDHPNVVRFVGLSWRTLPDLCMVSEYVALGDLAHFLAQPESKYLTWKDDKLPIAADISNALVYLHSLSPVVLHRDLKSLNVLLTEDLQAKVSDFGLSRETSFDETMTSGVGTLLWTAPEVLRGERYSEKADIYSFGVVLAELDTCLPPYAYSQGRKNKGKNDMDWVPLIASGRASPPFRPDCPRALRDLAAQCLDQDPNKRPPAMQIVYLLRSKIPHTL